MTPSIAASGATMQHVARTDHHPRQDVPTEPIGAHEVFRARRQVARREVVERVVRRDPLARGSARDDPADDDDVADDEGRSPDAGRRSSRAAPAPAPRPAGVDDAARSGVGIDRDVHQRLASRRIRGFIQAMMRSATSVASMYTMPITMAPAVSIGMSLRCAANSMVAPMPL